jgi:O-antigen/teichoic acid export membrane protein
MKDRLSFKVVSTGLNFILSLVIGIIVPRVVGPIEYGQYSYIIASYAFVFQLLMVSSNVAYIYFLSNNKYSTKAINTFYFYFLFLVTCIAVFISAITINTDFGIQYFWNGLDKINLLYLGLVYGIFLNLQDVLTSYSDSTTQTIISEKIKLLSKFIIVLLIIYFVMMDSLNINKYFVLLISNFIVFYLLFIKYVDFKFLKMKKPKFTAIFADFFYYIKPLIFFTFIAASYSFLGKFVLQNTSGSLEQGYYNFAYQLALIPVVFINSIMSIFMSEMTKMFQENRIFEIKRIFTSSIIKVYAVHAFISFFMILNAEQIILISVGVKYIGAKEAFQSLTFFSLLHTFGIFNRNIFLSSGRTKQYSLINSLSMLVGIAYFVHIMNTSNLTSSHLAKIMVLFYLFRVFIQLVINIRFLGVNSISFFLELFLSSLIILGALFSISSLQLNFISISILSIFTFIILNFIFNDYLNIKSLTGFEK